jgi:prepilin peptidase CpaA
MLSSYTHDLSTIYLLFVVFTAVITDFQSNRIPNWLTFSTLIVGVALQAFFLGTEGLIVAVAGISMGLVFLLPFFLLGGMGAGDVKMMAAIGAFIGYKSVMFATAYSLMIAAVYALVLVTIKGELMTSLQRYTVSIASRTYVPSSPDSVARKRFPFALAIAGGTIVVLMMESQLSFHHLSAELSYQLKAWGVGQ